MQTHIQEFCDAKLMHLLRIYRSVSLYISIHQLCSKAKLMSYKYVKLLLDVQRSVFNDVRSNMRTFNKDLFKFEMNVCDLISITLFLIKHTNRKT